MYLWIHAPTWVMELIMRYSMLSLFLYHCLLCRCCRRLFLFLFVYYMILCLRSLGVYIVRLWLRRDMVSINRLVIIPLFLPSSLSDFSFTLALILSLCFSLSCFIIFSFCLSLLYLYFICTLMLDSIIFHQRLPQVTRFEMHIYASNCCWCCLCHQVGREVFLSLCWRLSPYCYIGMLLLIYY